MPRWLVGGVVVLVAVLSVPVGCFGGARVVNDLTLSSMVASHQLVTLPEGVEELAFHSEVGLQVCCSNHCDFFVGSALSGVDGVVVPDGYELVTLPFEGDADHWEQVTGFEKLRSEALGASAFLVRFEQSFAGFAFSNDLRCH